MGISTQKCGAPCLYMHNMTWQTIIKSYLGILTPKCAYVVYQTLEEFQIIVKSNLGISTLKGGAKFGRISNHLEVTTGYINSKRSCTMFMIFGTQCLGIKWWKGAHCWWIWWWKKMDNVYELAQRLIYLEIPVFVRSLKSNNVMLY